MCQRIVRAALIARYFDSTAYAGVFDYDDRAAVRLMSATGQCFSMPSSRRRQLRAFATYRRLIVIGRRTLFVV